ncbi:hypothetical protein V4C53_30105 [Paraburkholderia azotifigens]|uniref:hypothetical protein n=1 Tax=Paraburkholderia azotifigens TaxID=2057004 RepID=UPI003174F4EF
MQDLSKYSTVRLLSLDPETFVIEQCEEISRHPRAKECDKQDARHMIMLLKGEISDFRDQAGDWIVRPAAKLH